MASSSFEEANFLLLTLFLLHDSALALLVLSRQTVKPFVALERFGAPLAAHQVTPEHFANEGEAYRFGIAPLKVEVLTQISGVSFDEARTDSQIFDLDGRWIPYIGLAALIRNKKAVGRHKDLADVEELERE